MQTCHVCQRNNSGTFEKFEKYPICGTYLDNACLNNNEQQYFRQLDLSFCDNCFHIQANSQFSQNEIYNQDYGYIAVSTGVQQRFIILQTLISSKLKYLKFNRVIDIGCNQLNFLKLLKISNISAKHWIGIDPIQLNDSIEKDDIKFINGYAENVDIPYFDTNLPDLIIADQVLEHIPNVGEFLAKFSTKISDSSIFVVCVPSLELIMKNLCFHDIIHDHVNYFSEHSLQYSFRNTGCSVEESFLNNDCPRGYLVQMYRKDGKNVAKDVKKDYFSEFNDTFLLYKQNLNISKRIAESFDDKIYAIGASELTPNLAYFMNSNFDFIEKIFDTTIGKNQKYMPNIVPQIHSPPEDRMFYENSIVFITAPQVSRSILKNLIFSNVKRIINPLALF
jgi:hypothetical protein